jgi:hypothetical protein
LIKFLLKPVARNLGEQTMVKLELRMAKAGVFTPTNDGRGLMEG